MKRRCEAITRAGKPCRRWAMGNGRCCVHGGTNEGCRCNAKTRSGKLCQRWPMKGRKRCYMHGGASTGPKTPEGLAKALSCLKRGKTGERGQRLRNPRLLEQWSQAELWRALEAERQAAARG